jgi:superfamily II DNA/RNA helicase
MYQKRFTGQRPTRRPSRSGGGSSFRGAKKPQRGNYIDPTKFISKAVVGPKAAPFTPTHKFIDFALTDALKKNIVEKGYELPTPIQDKAIPEVIEGKDVVGIANTGTGKTAAFLLPLINKVLGNPHEKVLIMAPTRELAIQIDQELRGFTKGMAMASVCTVGGTPMRPQLKQLKNNNNFIIGTPGRIKDLVERRAIRLGAFQTLVLDEADRMLDMGFIGDMRHIVKGMPEKRQTLFFSATLSSEIERLISEFLTAPVRISVTTGETAKNVNQDVVKVGSGDVKIEKLHDILNEKDCDKVIVFGATKHGVERLSKDLITRGFKAEALHGDKSHSQRQRALKRFKDDLSNILVATDVAARGLDIPDVSHVINYDIPMTYEDYVHRIGRTGRGDKTGKALTFIGGGASDRSVKRSPSYSSSRPSTAPRPKPRAFSSQKGRRY